MRRLPTRLDGPILLQPVAHGDQRGFFLEAYGESDAAELGFEGGIVEDNHSRSGRGPVAKATAMVRGGCSRVGLRLDPRRIVRPLAFGRACRRRIHLIPASGEPVGDER